jgi:molecular chaperone DnaJ
MFGAGGPAGPADGGDVAVAIEIELAEVLTGISREVDFEVVETCEHCRGNGAEPGTPITTCETCGGQGQVRQVSRTPFGQVMRTGSCPTCRGSGKTAETPCEVCDGEGRTVGRKSYAVDVPAGIEHGQRIRIGGAGHAGEAGGRPGDLFVQVAVAADERFVREGTDLLTVAEIPATTAMLGATIEVPTIEGSEEVEVEPGSQHGDTVRLRGQGLPSLRSTSRGDLHVALKVMTPVKLDDEQRELVERLEATLGDRNVPKAAREGLFERVRKAFR